MMDYKRKVIDCFKNSEFIFSEDELKNIEFADFGLGNIEAEGLNLIVYINNDRYCAKEMVLLPNQTCPEHKHPNRNDNLGKQETFRCRKGIVYLYVEGAGDKKNIHCKLPKDNADSYTVFKEIKLLPGEQYTIDPDTKHWFQAGDSGAIISEFSSPSDDGSDIFTNPKIKRN